MRILKEPGAPPVLPSLLFFLFSRKWIADTRQVEEQLKALYDEGFRSLAIVFVHSYTYPQHEEIVGNLARKIGFEHVSESSKLVPMIKMVLRGVSSTADAYLTPILRQYLDGFFSGFDKSLKEGTYHADELAHEGALEYHLRCAISDRATRQAGCPSRVHGLGRRLGGLEQLFRSEEYSQRTRRGRCWLRSDELGWSTR